MPPRYPYGCSPLGHAPYSAGLYASAIQESFDPYPLGTVEVKLLSHTASFKPVMLSSGGKDPVSAFLLTSMNFSAVTLPKQPGKEPCSLLLDCRVPSAKLTWCVSASCM